jgi:hypothetical protein
MGARFGPKIANAIVIGAAKYRLEIFNPQDMISIDWRFIYARPACMMIAFQT